MNTVSRDCKILPEMDAPRVFPSEIIVQVKALACELPFETGLPLSRFSSQEIAREVTRRGIVGQISGSTVWRWLSEDAIKPWQYRSWIFPRDPHFEGKAARVLDLYHRIWDGVELQANEFVLSADEKTSIQARQRKHKPLASIPGIHRKVEHEYERLGALNYIAAWDIQHARLFGRCEAKTGIDAFDRLVAEVMSQQPYASARRVFWIVDNGSSHRGQAAVDRIQSRWPTVVLVYLPVHASWLNQIEIYFSILQRKVLTPNDFPSLEGLAHTILLFQRRYERTAKPFEWKFTKDDLSKVMKKLAEHPTVVEYTA
jgi:transposase